MTQPDPDHVRRLSEFMLTALEELRPIGEGVDGYRQQWLSRGYTPAAAEQMAVAFHGHVIALYFAVIERNRAA